jgi:putative FmdB family regulatory protein
MPIFEYECGSCGTPFELLVRSDTAIACPACSSATVKKKLSLFASHTARPSLAPPSCHTGGQGCDLGRCGSGRCGAG